MKLKIGEDGKRASVKTLNGDKHKTHETNKSIGIGVGEIGTENIN